MESLATIIEERFELIKRLEQKSYCVCQKCGKEWRTTTVNGSKTYDLSKPCVCGGKRFETKPLYDNYQLVLAIFQELAVACKTEIHEYLMPLNAEEAVREYIKRIVAVIFPILNTQIKKLKTLCLKYRKKQNDRLEDTVKLLKAYLDVQDDFLAIVAFRHFETFVLYIDKHLYNSRLFTPALHLFKGFYYYANSMALNQDVRFIEKQCFAGAGKSATDAIFMTFLFGMDKDTDVLKIFGSKDNVPNAIDMVTSIMLSPAYAKVFPYYSQFNCDERQMFQIYKASAGDLKITGSRPSMNLRVRSKFDKCDGIRCRYLFLDDITLADDKDKVERHKNDIYLYTARWFLRKYDEGLFCVIASGTTYHTADILTYLKGIFGVERAKPSKFKFTSVAVSDEIMPNGLSVFCVIYGLDENDRSVFEEKFSTTTFRNMRSRDNRTFMAMVQQQPLPPEGAPFDYENLPNLYGEEGIPHLPDRSQECCVASLDPARKGKDFHSMPIFVNINGEYYLQDCLFENCPPDQMPLKIVKMIEQHHIVHLDIENNTDTSLHILITKLLKERGIEYCQITNFFSYKNKEEKIAEMETAIKSIHYPKRDVFSSNSAMGKFMFWFTGYNYDVHMKHDDSVDSLANFALRFLVNKNKTSTKAKLLSRRA